MISKIIIWSKLKERLNTSELTFPLCREGEKWWVYFGENIDIEINGKGVQFTRPAIILKKLNSRTLLVVPVTTQQKFGSWFVTFNYKGISETAVLSQIRIISSKPLSNC